MTTVEVKGQGSPVQELLLPYHGQFLRGEELRDRLFRWDRLGVLEPSAVDAVIDVVDHPKWLRLDGYTVVVLGDGAEMDPIGPLLRGGFSGCRGRPAAARYVGACDPGGSRVGRVATGAHRLYGLIVVGWALGDPWSMSEGTSVTGANPQPTRAAIRAMSRPLVVWDPRMLGYDRGGDHPLHPVTSRARSVNVDPAVDAEYARKYRGSTSAIAHITGPGGRTTTMGGRSSMTSRTKSIGGIGTGVGRQGVAL